MRPRPSVLPSLLAATLAATGCVAEPDLESSEQDLDSEQDLAAELEETAALEESTTHETDTATLAGCQLYAEQPYWLAGSIVGTGSWSNCPSNASITVVMRHDRSWWFDRTLTSRSGSGSFGYVDLSYWCGTDFDPIKVFIEVRYGSQKVQSVRSIVPCG